MDHEYSAFILMLQEHLNMGNKTLIGDVCFKSVLS
jgi:hypothetical protein